MTPFARTIARPVLLLFSLGLLPAAASAQRSVAWSVDSESLPCIRVLVDPGLEYLGRAEGAVMDGRARAERFLFGTVEDGRLTRAAIAHFEGMVGDGTFDYPRFRMDTIAGDEYLHQVWPIPEFALFASAPLDSVLAARGIRADADWLVNRWARVVDAERQHEILLFYLEPAATLGVSVAALREDWQPQGIAGASHAALEAAFIGRARRAIRPVAGPCGHPAS